MITEEEKDNCYCLCDEVEVVVPAPRKCCIPSQCSCNDRSKCRKWDGRQEKKCRDIWSVLISYQFHQHKTVHLSNDQCQGRSGNSPETRLNSTRKADEDGTTDDGRDVMCGCVDDRTQYTERASNYHEPSATEDVAQSSDESQANTRAKCLHDWNENVVGIRSNISIDYTNGVGRKHIACVVWVSFDLIDLIQSGNVPR